MTQDPDADARTLRKIAATIARGIAETSPRQEPAPGPARLTPDGQHLAKLAHELKTPLSAILAAAEIMRDERFGSIGDPRYQGYATGIYDSAHHALGVINAMLGQASPVTADQEEALAFTELDLNVIADSVASSVGALLEAAGLSIETRLKAGLPHVVADAVTVRQILLNLVTNAMRATPAGGMIAIETAYDLAGPVHLTVADTGSGMTDDEIARALDAGRETEFEPRSSGGLGIGFPLVLRLAALNGAEISIESDPSQGIGTRVAISFAPGRVIPV